MFIVTFNYLSAIYDFLWEEITDSYNELTDEPPCLRYVFVKLNTWSVYQAWTYISYNTII
jgi:hypothetical protein